MLKRARPQRKSFFFIFVVFICFCLLFWSLLAGLAILHLRARHRHLLAVCTERQLLLLELHRLLDRIIDLLRLGIVEARPLTLAAVRLAEVAVVVGGVPEVLLAADGLADPLLLGLLCRRLWGLGHRSGCRSGGSLLGLAGGLGGSLHLGQMLRREHLLWPLR